jgi:hypothetical protein
MPAKNTIIAVALMMCITFKLKLLGRLLSFLRKKYMKAKITKKGSGLSGAFFKVLIFVLIIV